MLNMIKFFITWVILVVVASGCGLQKAPDAVLFVIPAAAKDCAFTQVEDELNVFTCPACVIKATGDGTIVYSSC